MMFLVIYLRSSKSLLLCRKKHLWQHAVRYLVMFISVLFYSLSLRWELNSILHVNERVSFIIYHFCMQRSDSVVFIRR